MAWISKGKGDNVRHVPISEKQSESLQYSEGTLFDLPDGNPDREQVRDAYTDAIITIETLSDIELNIKEALVDVEPYFDDPEVFEQLKNLIQFMYMKTVEIMSRLNNTVKNFDGNPSTKGLLISIRSGMNESREIADIMQNIPQYNTPVGKTIADLQEQVTKDLERVYDELSNKTPAALIDLSPTRINSDWNHTLHGKLKDYSRKYRKATGEHHYPVDQ